MKYLKLGIIGLSPGNGHPYSWAAICNGYNKSEMSKCPFPVIPQYLNKQKFPDDQLKNAIVTHIWTQDKKLSTYIAQASKIPNIVNNLEDLIGKVDGVLLARDDAEKHLQLATPFLRAGIPIYIDKPIATNLKTLTEIFKLRKHRNQIFTCSALSFAKELKLSTQDKINIKNVKFIDAKIMKKWSTYAVHIIEPVVTQLPKNIKPTKFSKLKNGQINQLTVTWSNGLVTRFTTTGNVFTPIIFTYTNESTQIIKQFSDTFLAFKNALQKFVKIIENKDTPFSDKFVTQIVNLIEQGS